MWNQLLCVLLPEPCVLCTKPPRAVCAECADQLVARPRVIHRAGCEIVIASDAEQAVLRVLRAFKDDLRTGLGAPLANLLTPAVEFAIERYSAPDIIVVPPTSWSSWRRRGFHPLRKVLSRAGLRSYPALGRRRFVADQRRLGVRERRANISGAFRVRRAVAGARVMVIDDVMTTGATMAECIRTLEAAGASVVCAVALVQVSSRVNVQAQ